MPPQWQQEFNRVNADKQGYYVHKILVYRLAASHVEPVVVTVFLVEVVPVPVEILVGEAVLEPPVLQPLVGLPHAAHHHLQQHASSGFDCVRSISNRRGETET